MSSRIAVSQTSRKPRLATRPDGLTLSRPPGPNVHLKAPPLATLCVPCKGPVGSVADELT